MSEIIQIDTSNIRNVLDKIHSRAKSTAHRALATNLTKHANKLVRKLNENAPSQWRTDDKRFAGKLNQSFKVQAQGDSRQIMTTEPRKLALVSTRTQAHPILPNYKKALWWPGLQRPVAWVSLHPGNVSPNHFVEETIDEVGLTPDAQAIADMIASGVTGTDDAGSAWNYYGNQTKDFSDWGGPVYD